MTARFRIVGFILAAIGLAFVTAGAVAYTRVQDGYGSLQAFSEQQNVTLTYNEEGQLTDRGETAEADAIMSLLTDDWQYPVVQSAFDPGDPLVNTPSEYMFQMATVAFHTLNGTTTVVLDEPVEYNGEVFEAGSYDVATDGRYWTQFDRQSPLDGPARELAWTGTVHGLIGELGVGTVTGSTLQLGLAMAGLFAGIGATLLLAGFGIVWATKAQEVRTIDLTVTSDTQSPEMAGV